MRTVLLLSALCLLGASCAHKTPDVTPVVPPKPTPPKPVAGFNLPLSAEATVTMRMQNTSTNAARYTLAWGDGTTATDSAASLSHTYTTPGKVRLRMTATGPGGTDTISKVLTIMNPPPPTNVAGRYKGRLHYYYFDPFSPVIRWERDTIIQFSQLTPTSLQVFGVETFYETMPPGSPWYGHKPARSCYSYSRSVSGGRVIFQRAWNSDSVYADGHIGGQGGGDNYQFYGKKL